ncbi:MAG: hypothetical protein EU530_00150 [Promethearchaeota archaeon]|nr:MAG: hypothetical protein EU530_00150 [Candidatus Lokiarchaeota archaeon]
MAKKIKTTRYWTRKCPNCTFEYPNWFTVCPKCHASWKGEGGISVSETSATSEQPTQPQQPVTEKEKTIKIIAQLTEDDVRISKLTLFFSADNGISWFQMDMIREADYFAADIMNVPINSTIVYYLKGIDENNLEFTEDNSQNYYYYHVTESVESELPETQPPVTAPTKSAAPYMNQPSAETLSPVQKLLTPHRFQHELDIPPVPPKQGSNPPQSGVVFTPLDQVQRDANLKLCMNCKSKIKSDWGICPICGSPQPN